MNNEQDKPKILYRGIIIRYEQLNDFKFDGIELKPPYPPEIDKDGRKVVQDGNEYGVYMTDHELVAREFYGKPKRNDGTPIDKTIVFDVDKSRTVVPAIGIVYKIDTEGVDVHIPWITSYLKGHYNNGAGGNEWIAESIPEQNYSVDTIEIGPDTLHDSEMISAVDINEAKAKIIQIVEARKRRLELFEKKIEEMPIMDRLNNSQKLNILKEIYKLNGIMDVDLEQFTPVSASDYLKFLMATSYSMDKDNIDFTTLSYIADLKAYVRKGTTPEDILNHIQKDIDRNNEKKESFITRKKMQNEEYSTTSFDKRNAMYIRLMNQLTNKIRNVGDKDKSELLDDAISTTEETITTSQINEQVQNIRNTQKEIEQGKTEEQANDIIL